MTFDELVAFVKSVLDKHISGEIAWQYRDDVGITEQWTRSPRITEDVTRFLSAGLKILGIEVREHYNSYPETVLLDIVQKHSPEELYVNITHR
jgi:hypothetical protein